MPKLLLVVHIVALALLACLVLILIMFAVNGLRESVLAGNTSALHPRMLLGYLQAVQYLAVPIALGAPIVALGVVRRRRKGQQLLRPVLATIPFVLICLQDMDSMSIRWYHYVYYSVQVFLSYLIALRLLSRIESRAYHFR